MDINALTPDRSSEVNKSEEEGNQMRKQVMLAIGMLLGISACAMELGEDPKDHTSLAVQALDATRARVIQECSQAMSGSWWTYNETNWPTAETPSTYDYAAADQGAWSKLLEAYSGTAQNGTHYHGFWASCMRTRAEGHLPAPYSGCQLSTTAGYGSFQIEYACQGNCSVGPKRGGQCKGFMNLVAYRSGLYQNSGYTFRTFPKDDCIAYTSATCMLPPASRIPRPANDPNMPKATFANIEPGDYLRRPGGHAAIVVRKISSSQVVVLDSNWVGGGDGHEIVGSHSLAFTGSGSNSDLGAYRVLKCVYLGGC